MKLLEIDDLSNIFSTDRVSDSVFTGALSILEGRELYMFDPKLIENIKKLDREDPSDQATELYYFWLDYLRQYMTWKVSEIIARNHGVEISRTGIIVFQDSEGSTKKADALNRKRVIQEAEQEQAHYLSQTRLELKRLGYVIDSVEYKKIQFTHDTGQRMGFTAVGKLNYKQRRL